MAAGGLGLYAAGDSQSSTAKPSTRPNSSVLWVTEVNWLASAVAAISRSFGPTGPLVLYTEEGHPWVRTEARIQDDGSSTYTTVNAITAMFSRLLKKTKMGAPNGTGFYMLRRTAATLAARSGGPFAVQRLLGHVNLEMATRYVQDVSARTDRANSLVQRREEVREAIRISGWL